ncbi:MAG: MarR family transcriptional regulator [Candidatus Thorarchaeota archaeon]
MTNLWILFVEVFIAPYPFPFYTSILHDYKISDITMTADSILQRWFDVSIQPSNTMLWVSAVAPDTFQGNPRFLQELLNRPLERPDAMGRRRARARYGTCLIAHAINLLNPQPAAFVSLLHEFNFFRQPDTILQKPLPDELIQKILHLIEQPFDPTHIWKKQLPQLNQFFRDSMKKVREVFGIHHGKTPTLKIKSYFSFEQEWWGVTLYYPERVLNILPPYLFLPYLARYLLLREAIRVYLPQCFQKASDVQEFANIVVEKFLDESQRQLWSQIKWGGEPPAQDLHQWIATISNLSPQLIRQKQLSQFFSRLKTIDRNASEVPTGAFTLLAKQQLSEGVKPVTLTSPQKTILLAIAQNPTASERQLAKMTQLARSTISRNLGSLLTQLKVKVQGQINYLKVGLQPLLLTVTLEHFESEELKTLSNLYQQLQSFPYCTRLVTSSNFTGTPLYAILTLPHATVPNFLDRLKNWTNNHRINADLAEISSYEWGWYFPYWSRVPIDEWEILAMSSLREIDPDHSVNMQITYTGPLTKITQEALRVIVKLQGNMRISHRQLAKEARTSITTVSKYFNRLIPHMIVPSVEIIKSPLQETMTFTISCLSGQLDSSIPASFRLFPAYQIWKLSPSKYEQRVKKPDVLISIGFSSGNLIPIYYSLNRVISQYNCIATTPLISDTFLQQIHELPIALFNTTTQEWMCPSRIIEPIFEG